MLLSILYNTREIFSYLIGKKYFIWLDVNRLKVGAIFRKENTKR